MDKQGPFIYFLCPDIDIPSGGINRLYRLAQITHSGGFRAAVLHEKSGFVNRWAPVVPPFCYWEKGLSLAPGDVLVIPESEPGAMQQVPDEIRKVVLALDWSYIFENLPPGHTWKGYGICQVLAASGVVRDFIEWSMALPVWRITPAIDRRLFYNDPQNKTEQVVYMAHRNQQGEWLEKIFRQLPRPVGDWEWTGVRGLPLSEYAALMRKAKIFVTTGLREGVPGPILEAMASGTIVVGYGGVGGNEYLVSEGARQNTFQVENDDYFSLGRTLERVMQMFAQKDPHLETIRQNGLETVRPLTFEAEQADMHGFWHKFLKMET